MRKRKKIARIIFYRDGSQYCAECLDFNLVGVGNTYERAALSLGNLIDYHGEGKGFEELFERVPLISKIRYYFTKLVDKNRTVCIVED